MVTKRRKISETIQERVLTSARRRCCLCVYLEDRDEVRKGQIAHINRDNTDTRFQNLVWLCFDHHDEYDSSTSQSKGLKAKEVKRYRDELYKRNWGDTAGIPEKDVKVVARKSVKAPPQSVYDKVRHKFKKEFEYLEPEWRFPLWQVANIPEYFAYKSPNRADSICLIERINLPDGRIVIAAIETEGTPGISITNAVEALCFQVCERFNIDVSKLVWLEHYNFYDDDYEWRRVTFSKMPPANPFAKPIWTTMTESMWNDLKLKPKKRLIKSHGKYQSKLTKRFYWPTEAILDDS